MVFNDWKSFTAIYIRLTRDYNEGREDNDPVASPGVTSMYVLDIFHTPHRVNIWGHTDTRNNEIQSALQWMNEQSKLEKEDDGSPATQSEGGGRRDNITNKKQQIFDGYELKQVMDIGPDTKQTHFRWQYTFKTIAPLRIRKSDQIKMTNKTTKPIEESTHKLCPHKVLPSWPGASAGVVATFTVHTVPDEQRDGKNKK